MRAVRVKRQLTMLRVLTLEELEAAERAGVDIVSVPPDPMLDPRFLDAAPGIFAMPGDNFYEIGGPEDFVRWAFRLYKATADAVYCSAGFNTVRPSLTTPFRSSGMWVSFPRAPPGPAAFAP